MARAGILSKVLGLQTKEAKFEDYNTRIFEAFQEAQRLLENALSSGDINLGLILFNQILFKSSSGVIIGSPKFLYDNFHNKLVVEGNGRNDIQQWILNGSTLSRIKSDGRFRNDGATTYKDLVIEPNVKFIGANSPNFDKWFDNGAGSIGINLYSFDDAPASSEKEIRFTQQFQHDWKEGTDIQFHVHWIGNVADTTATPRWGLEYSWKNLGQVFGNTTIVYATGNIDGSGTPDPNITAFKHYITAFSVMTPDNTQDKISSILVGRLFRDSANAADTYNAATNKCGLLSIDAHYEVDSLGSDVMYTKD